MKNIKVNKSFAYWAILFFPTILLSQNIEIEDLHNELKNNVENIIQNNHADDIFILYFEISECNDSLIVVTPEKKLDNHLNKEYVIALIREKLKSTNYPLNKYLYKLVYNGIDNKSYLEIYSTPASQ